MRIIINGSYVDFERPIHMTEAQRNDFIIFVKGILPEIEVVDVKEPEREGPEHVQPRRWSKQDYLLLLNIEDDKEVAQKTNRSERSVMIQRGQFIPEILSWAKEHGYSNITEKVIEEFLKK